ncbi:hypothetical protein QAD02_019678 [Eretmocerus hayati]|uniref:Uncharacterized protein n=1 Tax=Eretmocerus hayati TaxID=131215 RepID=A0ACC2PK99_9HYME|nr:hypothetical protein QAD02_019678 [Eretmocerus hayati]
MSATSELLKLFRRHLHDEYGSFPLDSGTLMKTPQNVEVVPLGVGEFTHYGLQRSINEQLIVMNFFDFLIIYIDLFVDGIPILNSRNLSLVALLGKIVHPLFSEPFFISGYYGKEKAPNVHEFMAPFQTEYSQLNVDGFTHEGHHYIVKVRLVTSDTVARNWILEHPTHLANGGCEKCVAYGFKVGGAMTFPDLNAMFKTDGNFRSTSPPPFNEFVSPIEEMDLGPVSRVPIEIMHQGHLGITKRFLNYWLEMFGKGEGALQIYESFNENYRALAKCVPLEFAKKPRAPAANRQLLSHNQLVHFNALNCAMRILSDPEFCISLNSEADKLLRYFVENVEVLYGRERMVFCVHSAIHLAADVMNFGSLEEYCSYCYESYLDISPRPLPTTDATNGIREAAVTAGRGRGRGGPRTRGGSRGGGQGAARSVAPGTKKRSESQLASRTAKALADRDFVASISTTSETGSSTTITRTLHPTSSVDTLDSVNLGILVDPTDLTTSVGSDSNPATRPDTLNPLDQASTIDPHTPDNLSIQSFDQNSLDHQKSQDSVTENIDGVDIMDYSEEVINDTQQKETENEDTFSLPETDLVDSEQHTGCVNQSERQSVPETQPPLAGESVPGTQPPLGGEPVPDTQVVNGSDIQYIKTTLNKFVQALAENTARIARLEEAQVNQPRGQVGVVTIEPPKKSLLPALPVRKRQDLRNSSKNLENSVEMQAQFRERILGLGSKGPGGKIREAMKNVMTNRIDIFVSAGITDEYDAQTTIGNWLRRSGTRYNQSLIANPNIADETSGESSEGEDDDDRNDNRIGLFDDEEADGDGRESNLDDDNYALGEHYDDDEYSRDEE